jgi:hypothetical protein
MREVVTLRRHLHALFAARIDDLPPPPDAVRGCLCGLQSGAPL